MDTTPFEDRVAEIESYISLLQAVELQAQSGPPEIGNSAISAPNSVTVTLTRKRPLTTIKFEEIKNGKA